MTPHKCLKMLKLIEIGALGLKKTFDNMVLRCMPNSDPWKPRGTSFMTILVFYVNPQIPNIEKNEANEVYKSW